MKLFNVFKDFSIIVKNKLNNDGNVVNKLRSTNLDENLEEEMVEPSFFDGMGSATATEIIKRRIDQNDIDEYGITDLENTGRYYIAHVSEGNGSIIHTLMVDKQNGMIRSLSRKATARSMS